MCILFFKHPKMNGTLPIFQTPKKAQVLQNCVNQHLYRFVALNIGVVDFDHKSKGAGRTSSTRLVDHMTCSLQHDVRGDAFELCSISTLCSRFWGWSTSSQPIAIKESLGCIISTLYNSCFFDSFATRFFSAAPVGSWELLPPMFSRNRSHDGICSSCEPEGRYCEALQPR